MRYSARKVCFLARSPVMPKITRMSAAAVAGTAMSVPSGGPSSRDALSSWQDKPLHRVGEALVLVGCRDPAGGPLDLGTRVTHGDAKPRVGEHEHVVGLVADRGDLRSGDPEGLREVAGHAALVGVGVGDVAVVRLGSRGRHVVTEALANRVYRPLDRVVIVAHPHDLGDPGRDRGEAVDMCRVELDR